MPSPVSDKSPAPIGRAGYAPRRSEVAVSRFLPPGPGPPAPRPMVALHCGIRSLCEAALCANLTPRSQCRARIFFLPPAVRRGGLRFWPRPFSPPTAGAIFLSAKSPARRPPPWRRRRRSRPAVVDGSPDDTWGGGNKRFGKQALRRRRATATTIRAASSLRSPGSRKSRALRLDPAVPASSVGELGYCVYGKSCVI
jgi:hypothetical protein